MIVLDALTIGPHALRILRALVRSVSRKSEGGRRITPAEGEQIATELRGLAGAVLRALGVPVADVDLAELRVVLGLPATTPDTEVVRRAVLRLRAGITAPEEPLTIPASLEALTAKDVG